MSAVANETPLAATAPTEHAAEDAAVSEEAPPNPVMNGRLQLKLRGVSAEALADGLFADIGNHNLPERAIINNIELKSCFSDVDAPVDISMQLFRSVDGDAVSASDLSIENKHGWLPSEHNTPDTFSTIASLHPCESGRFGSGHSLYTPASALQNRFISQYGHLSPAKLRESIIRYVC